jgi:rhodanese-related sulfurtransferase
MKKILVITMLIISLASIMAGCGASEDNQNNGYMRITAEEAKQIMDTEDNYVILDVRTQEEFDEGHIPGAILIPDYEIEDRAEAELKDKEQTILVYCRSGNRSKVASAALAELGYTNVKEFGGIIDWPYEVEFTLKAIDM